VASPGVGGAGVGRAYPNVFREEHQRSGPPGTVVERSLLETEGYVRDFAEDNPHVTVSMLRFSNVLGEQIRTPLSKALSLPVVPRIFGFDPRFQFVHEDDVIRAILFVLEHNLPGVYNVAGDGLLPWSEVAGICGKQTFPLPPFGFRGIASAPLSRLGIDLTPELLDLMRYGRGVDNRRLKAAGFRYGYTSAGAVQAFVASMRLRRTVGAAPDAYRYERDVEQFFRHSPAVVRDASES
jgi:UDP-glucose 4-epimerase